jgi:hypothetical protein
VIDMRMSILNTVQNSYGQAVTRTVKAKQTDMTAAELDEHLAYLIEYQAGQCALSGIPFDYHSPDGDNGPPGPPPTGSTRDGHYHRGNIQVVCQFINFWKGSQTDEEFRRLLAKVREV